MGSMESGRQWRPTDSQVDIHYDIRTDHLVKSRSPAPEFGWRRAVRQATFNLVNLGLSAFERRLAEQKTLIASNIAGTYQIPVISIKGGVGKTRTVAGIGTVFGLYRTEPVIAIDPNAPASLRNWLDDQLHSPHSALGACSAAQPPRR
jgi:hypothetical protein